MKEKLKKKVEISIYQIVLLICFMVALFLLTTDILLKIEREKNEIAVRTQETNIQKFTEMYDVVKDGYYKKVDLKKGVDGAINGFLKTLDDPHTVYFNIKETKDFNDMMLGKYKGIGAEVTDSENKEVVILSLFKNSPALKAGIKPNDIIIKVNNKSTIGMTSSEVVALIKDPKNEQAKIIVKRGTEELEFNIVKEMITIDSVEYEVYKSNNKNIGYIAINIFAGNTYDQFSNILQELEKEDIDSLIIDVRNNGGGQLDSVDRILNLFFKKGEIIYQIKDNSKTIKYKDTTDKKADYKVSVLINESSASASEILAVAFKEGFNSEIIGIKSYGKGTVQGIHEFSDGAMLKFTIQKWLSPKGNWINKTDVAPTIEVKQSESYISKPIYDNDLQLKKAIEVMGKN